MESFSEIPRLGPDEGNIIEFGLRFTSQRRKHLGKKHLVYREIDTRKPSLNTCGTGTSKRRVHGIEE